MDQGHAACPNCRQIVPTHGTAGSLLRCGSCGVQLQLAADGEVTFPQPLMPPPPRPAEPAAPPQPISSGFSGGPPLAANPPAMQSRRATSGLSRSRSFGLLEVAKVVGGGAVGLGLGYLVILALSRGGNADPKEKASRPSAAAASARFEPKSEFPQFADLPQVEAAPAQVRPASLPPAASLTPAGAISSPSGNPPQPPERIAAASQPVSPKPQPPPAQPLAGLTDVIKLPSLVDTAPVVLCRLHLPPGANLAIGFNTVAANVPREAAFLAEPQSGSQKSWLVCYFPDAQGAPGDKRVLGEMRHSGGELSFGWRMPIEDADARQELSHCLLKLSCGDVSRTALLREPQQAPRLKLDLQRAAQVHEWSAAGLPKEESLRLEIAELPGFPTGTTLEDERRVLRLKERTTIQFAHIPGAEIGVEFRRVEENLQVVLRPEFRENAAESFPMTLPRLADFKAHLQRAIPQDEARIVALGKELKSLDRQLKSLGSRPASGPAFVAWQGRVRNLQSAASRAKSERSRLQRRLPEMKARLANAPQLEKFLGDLHARGALRLKVYAECGDARLVVTDMKLDSAVPQ